MLTTILAFYAAISGVVTDTTGASIPDVEVTAGRQRTKTNADGTFRLDDVKPGEHVVRAVKPGFAEGSAKVRVLPDADAEVNLSLAVADVQAQLTVTAEPDPLMPDTSSVALTVEQSDALPALDGDIAALFPMADTTVVVDGVEQPLSKVMMSTVESVRLVTDGYSAEYSRPGRGRLEITTKRGTGGGYRGSAAFNMRDARWAARNAFAATRPNGNRGSWEASLSGPKFVLSAEGERDRRQNVVFARTLAGDVRENVTVPSDEFGVSGRVYHWLGEKHQLSARTEYEVENSLGGVGGFRLPENASTRNTREYELQGTWQAIWSSALLNQFVVNLDRESDVTRPNGTGPQITVQGAFVGGASTSDSQAVDWQLRMSNVTSIVRGNHQIRTGVQLSQMDWTRARYRDRFAGAWTYASLEDYAAQRPLYYEVNQGNPDFSYWRGVAAMFAQDAWRIRQNIQLGFGLRAEWHNAPSPGLRYAPRVSLAWAVSKSTRIRTGAGMFLDTSAVQLAPDTRLFDGTRLQEILVMPEVTTARTPNVVRFAPDIRTPYMLMTNVGVEHSFSKSIKATARLLTSRTVALYRSRDANAPLAAGLPRPDDSLGVIRLIEPAGRRALNALDLELRGRLTTTFSGSLEYTLSSTRDNSAGPGWFPMNSIHPQDEWARANNDRRHSFRVVGVTQVPKFAEIGLVLDAYSGSPYNITTGRDDNGDGRTNDRPLGVGRNTGQSPGAVEFDIRLSREFGKDSRVRTRLSLDAFNVTNRVNLGPVVGNMTSPFFGQSATAGNARRMQVGVRFYFR